MNKRDFLKSAGIVTLGAMMPSTVWAMGKGKKLRTAHIGVNNMVLLFK